MIPRLDDEPVMTLPSQTIPSDVRRDVTQSCGVTTPPWRMVVPVWAAVRRDWTHWRLRRQRLSEVPPWFCPRCGIDLLANPTTRLTLVGVPPLPTLSPCVQCDCGHRTTLTRDGLVTMATLP